MSADDEQSTGEDFQIVDASCFETNVKKPGLEFHLNFPCPVCGSYQSNFICAKCVNAGSFTSSRNPDGPSYSEVCKNLTAVQEQINVLNKSFHIQDFEKSSCGPKDANSTEELTVLITSLRSAIFYWREQNQKKLQKRERLRELMTRCHTSSYRLSKKSADVTEHSSRIAQRKKMLLKNLTSCSRQIEKIRVNCLKELFCSNFTVEVSPDNSPDKLSGASLHIDKENIFVGPEPMLSSHTALTYCVPAIHAAAVLLDVWLPSVICQQLRLSGPFLSTLPQRDNLGRVYSSVIHAVHLLCSSRCINMRARMEQLGMPLASAHSEHNPLIGLYCLGRSEPLKEFDASYTLSLEGFFGDLVPPAWEPRCLPALGSLRLERHVEQGEEVRELEGEEEIAGLLSRTRIHGASAPGQPITTPTIQNRIGHLMPMNADVNNSECWELITTTESSTLPMEHIENTHWVADALNVVWSMTKTAVVSSPRDGRRVDTTK